MIDFIQWLRVELLRLRGFDFGPGSRGIHWLKDGVAKLSSYYRISELAEKSGIAEDELLGLIDSPLVLNELEEKGFTINWRGEQIALTWLESGISEWKIDINQHYSEEDGNFYSEHRITEKVVYLDGTERIVKDTGDPKRVRVSKEVFMEALEQISKANKNKGS